SRGAGVLSDDAGRGGGREGVRGGGRGPALCAERGEGGRGGEAWAWDEGRGRGRGAWEEEEGGAGGGGGVVLEAEDAAANLDRIMERPPSVLCLPPPLCQVRAADHIT